MLDEIIVTQNISALILAAGKGTRLGPAGKEKQKCMFCVKGKPILEHIINRLKSAGIVDIVISVSHLKEQVITYFGDGKRFGVKIRYLEKDFPDTYNALIGSLDTMQENILYCHGDILFDDKLILDMLKMKKHSKCNVLGVVKNRDNIKHAQLSKNQDLITEIDTKQRDGRLPFLCLGLSLYSKSDLLRLSCDNNGMAEVFVEQLLNEKKTVYAYEYTGEYFHIENMENYISANKNYKEY